MSDNKEQTVLTPEQNEAMVTLGVNLIHSNSKRTPSEYYGIYAGDTLLFVGNPITQRVFLDSQNATAAITDFVGVYLESIWTEKGFDNLPKSVYEEISRRLLENHLLEVRVINPDNAQPILDSFAATPGEPWLMDPQ